MATFKEITIAESDHPRRFLPSHHPSTPARSPRSSTTCTSINAGEQFIKSNPERGRRRRQQRHRRVLGDRIRDDGRDAYTNGVDVHTGANWIIRHNLFRNIRAPHGAARRAGRPDVERLERHTIAEGNTFINCQREIAFGLIERTPDDHTGGIIRNNFIYRQADWRRRRHRRRRLAEHAGAAQHHHSCREPIDRRSNIAFPERRVRSSRTISSMPGFSARDGASGSTSGNVTNAATSLFVNAAAGDLHLKSTATSVIDKAASVANCPNDWDGDPRPQGSARDVGADEFGSTTTTPAPQPPTNVRIIR